MKKKEKLGKKVQNDKKQIKLELERTKKEINEELLKKHENTKKLKIEVEKKLKEKKIEYYSAKKKNYQSALSDKQIMKCIKEQIDTQENNKNLYKIAKVKQQFNEYETNKIKNNILKENQELLEHESNLRCLKLIEKKMIKTFKELEMKEKECLESLNKTKYMNIKYMGNLKLNDNNKTIIKPHLRRNKTMNCFKKNNTINNSINKKNNIKTNEKNEK